MRSKPKAIGILGGTFNPIHKGHVAAARLVLSEGSVQKVLMMPSYVPAFKKENLESWENRTSMIHLALENEQNIELCDIEKDLGSPSYTFKTMKTLKNSYDDDLFFIVGSDLLGEIPFWKNYKEIFKYTNLLIIPRKGKVSKLPAELEGFPVRHLDVLVPEISSTHIREALSLGRPVENWVHGAVCGFIKNKKLYRKR